MPKKTEGNCKSGGALLIEVLLSLAVAAVVAGALLWHWDGFWQSDIPLLVRMQTQYLPEKRAEELAKAGRLSEIERVGALEAELRQLRAELAACREGRTGEGGDADR